MEFQAFAGDPETGTLSMPERDALRDAARRISALLQRPAASPLGTPANAVAAGVERYARAWEFATGTGVKADPAEAAYWYGLAAADGEVKAFTNLGTLLIRGEAGTSDPVGGALLWRAAAARGEPTAMFNLGAQSERGVGVPVDLDKARTWYARAAARHDAAAQAALKRLGA
jgi:TPR repeat protein